MPAAGALGGDPVDALHVALLAVGNPGALERPARLLAVVADRDRDEPQHHARAYGASGAPELPPGERRGCTVAPAMLRLGSARVGPLRRPPARARHGRGMPRAARARRLRDHAGRLPVLGPRRDVGRRAARHDGDAARARAPAGCRWSSRSTASATPSTSTSTPASTAYTDNAFAWAQARLRGPHLHRARPVGLVRHARRRGLANPAACARGYIHLADIRYEVARHAGADRPPGRRGRRRRRRGSASPATRYGGGQSFALAALRDRRCCPTAGSSRGAARPARRCGSPPRRR